MLVWKKCIQLSIVLINGNNEFQSGATYVYSYITYIHCVQPASSWPCKMINKTLTMKYIVICTVVKVEEIQLIYIPQQLIVDFSLLIHLP